MQDEDRVVTTAAVEEVPDVGASSVEAVAPRRRRSTSYRRRERTGKGPKCPVCREPTGSAAGMSSHLRQSHPDLWQGSLRATLTALQAFQGVTIAPTRIKPPPVMVNCEICGDKVKEKGLEVHKWRMHTTEGRKAARRAGGNFRQRKAKRGKRGPYRKTIREWKPSAEQLMNGAAAAPVPVATPVRKASIPNCPICTEHLEPYKAFITNCPICTEHLEAYYVARWHNLNEKKQ